MREEASATRSSSLPSTASLPFLLRIVIISRTVRFCNTVISVPIKRQVRAAPSTTLPRALVKPQNVEERRLSAIHQNSCLTWPYYHITLIKRKLEPALKSLDSRLLSTRILLITACSLKREDLTFMLNEITNRRFLNRKTIAYL